jgi:hypothetical protein
VDLSCSGKNISAEDNPQSYTLTVLCSRHRSQRNVDEHGPKRLVSAPLRIQIFRHSCPAFAKTCMSPIPVAKGIVALTDGTVSAFSGVLRYTRLARKVGKFEGALVYDAQMTVSPFHHFEQERIDWNCLPLLLTFNPLVTAEVVVGPEVRPYNLEEVKARCEKAIAVWIQDRSERKIFRGKMQAAENFDDVFEAISRYS